MSGLSTSFASLFVFVPACVFLFVCLFASIYWFDSVFAALSLLLSLFFSLCFSFFLSVFLLCFTTTAVCLSKCRYLLLSVNTQAFLYWCLYLFVCAPRSYCPDQQKLSLMETGGTSDWHMRRHIST